MKINLINYLNQRQKICNLTFSSLSFHLKINELGYKKFPDGDSLEAKAKKMEKSELNRLRREFLVEYCRDNKTKSYIMTLPQMRAARKQMQLIESELEEIDTFLDVISKDNERLSLLRSLVIETLKVKGLPLSEITTEGIMSLCDLDSLVKSTAHLFIMALRFSSLETTPKEFYEEAFKIYEL